MPPIVVPSLPCPTHHGWWTVSPTGTPLDQLEFWSSNSCPELNIDSSDLSLLLVKSDISIRIVTVWSDLLVNNNQFIMSNMGNPPTGPSTNPPTSSVTPAPAARNPPILPNPPASANVIDLVVMIQNMLQTMIANQLGGPSQPSTFNNINMIKFSNLNWFTGRSQDVDSFVKTIDNWILGSPGTFMADFQMTAYFMSWLGPRMPEKWYLGIWESQPNLLHDYAKFIEAFTKHFRDPDLVETAHWELATLWQTGSASTYVAQFWEIAVQCKHSEYDMHWCFIKGLKQDIQYIMLQNCPNKLEELYSLAIELDGLVYQMNKNEEEVLSSLKGKKPFNSFNSLHPFQTFQNQNPISFSTPAKPNFNNAEVQSVLNSEGKLNPVEKLHHHKLNVCLYCGWPGHQAKPCPTKKGKSILGMSSSALGKVDPQAWVPFSLWSQLGHPTYWLLYWQAPWSFQMIHVCLRGLFLF